MRDPGLRNQYRTELQVGALMIAALVALVLGVAWISGAQPAGDRLAFFAVAPEAAAVTEGTRVSLLGVDVGQVETVELRRNDVVLHLRIAYRGLLPQDTRGAIRASGFLGTMEIALLPGSSGQPLVMGDTIEAFAAPGLQDLAGALGDQASEILAQTRKLLSDSLIGDVHTGTEAFAGAVTEVRGMLNREVESLEALIESLSQASRTLADATEGPELDRTVAHIDTLTSRLADASGELDASSRSLSSILEKIDRGEGTLGRMVNDPALYDRLTAATENVQAASEEIALLTKDVREQPEKYLKGVKFSVF